MMELWVGGGGMVAMMELWVIGGVGAYEGTMGAWLLWVTTMGGHATLLYVLPCNSITCTAL